MATGGSNLHGPIEASMVKMRSLLNCGVCREEKTNLKLIPCSHSFCSYCLELVSRHSSHARRIACPLCAAQCKLPAAGVQGLPPDFRAEQLRELLQQMQEQHTVVQQESPSAAIGDSPGPQSLRQCAMCRFNERSSFSSPVEI